MALSSRVVESLGPVPKNELTVPKLCWWAVHACARTPIHVRWKHFPLWYGRKTGIIPAFGILGNAVACQYPAELQPGPD